VTSFGHVTGCEKGLPTGFIKVENYLDWIYETTGIDSEET
jgi:hypothetical protein